MKRIYNNGRFIERLEDINYATFVLGYDLLQNELIDSVNRTSDTAYEKCLKIATEFVDSDYNDTTKGLYTCLQEFIEDKQYDDLNN